MSGLTSMFATSVLLAVSCLSATTESLESADGPQDHSVTAPSGTTALRQTATLILDDYLRRIQESAKTQCSIDTDCSAQPLGPCLLVDYSNRSDAAPLAADIAAFRSALGQAYTPEEIRAGSFFCDAPAIRLGCIEGSCGGKGANSKLIQELHAAIRGIESRRCGKDGVKVPDGRYVSGCLRRRGYSLMANFQDAEIWHGDYGSREQVIALQYFSDGSCRIPHSGDIFRGSMLYGRDKECRESVVNFQVQTLTRIALSQEAVERFNRSSGCGEGFNRMRATGGSFLLQDGGRLIYDPDHCEPPLGSMEVPYGKRKWHSLFRLTQGRLRMGAWREWDDSASPSWERSIDLLEDATLNRGAPDPKR